MVEVEKLNIKLGLSGTYWSRSPQYRILFNDTVIQEAQITAPTGEIQYIEFEATCDQPESVLKIQLINKLNSDTIQSPDRTEILRDQLLNIESIEIDDINLGQLPFNLSEYFPDRPVEFENKTTTAVTQCINLGWNGTWTLKWSNPFYIWLLENI